jgi:hypothetical protein
MSGLLRKAEPVFEKGIAKDACQKVRPQTRFMRDGRVQFLDGYDRINLYYDTQISAALVPKKV